MKVTRRTLGSLALASPFVSTWATIRPAYADPPVRWISSPGHYYLAPFFATKTGIFSRLGLDVQMIIATSPPAMLPGVIGGSVQIGSSTAVQVAMARENGLDVAFLAASDIQWQGRPDTGIVVRTDSPIHQPSDFIGRRVASPGANGTFYLMFFRYLLNHGVDPNRVTMVEAGFGQMADLLRSGAADAVLATQPFIFQLLDSGLGRRIEYFEAPGPYTIDSFYICTKAWATAHPDQVAKAREGLRQAAAAMQANPAQTVAIEAETFKLSPDIIKRLGSPSFPSNITPADLTLWLDLGHKVGLLHSAENPADMIIP